MASIPEAARADWNRLWQFATRVAKGTADGPEAVFGPIGLFLTDPAATAQPWVYDATPVNAVTFANTGGDGVHFSVLTDVGRATPVVMTVPMAWDSPNHVLGADIREFLSFGCRSGYFALEQLAYASGPAAPGPAPVGPAVTAEDPFERAQALLLHALRAEFDLTPWPDATHRLASLAATFQQQIMTADQLPHRPTTA
jgi:hypothetical protein